MCIYRFRKAGNSCVGILLKNALDLINRQQAEIENLKHNLKCVKDHKEGLIERLQKNLDDKCDKCIARDRAEAIKEFERKIKAHAYYIDVPKEHRVVDEDDIDAILKEMTEGNQ